MRNRESPPKKLFAFRLEAIDVVRLRKLAAAKGKGSTQLAREAVVRYLDSQQIAEDKSA